MKHNITAKKKYPPIDWLMAAILERKRVMELTWQDIADEVGTSGECMRKLANKPPMSWDKYTREKVCKALGIEVRTYVVGSPEDSEYGIF